MEYQKFIKKALSEASEIALANFGKVTGQAKKEDSNQVLTETDLKIGKLLVNKIRQFYPQDSIIDEEAGVIKNHSEYTWVIDPIDGTSNFAEGVPAFGIIIGLLQQGTPIAGGVALPFFKEIILAEKGKGAYSNGKKLQVTKQKKLLSALVAYGIDGQQKNPKITHQECELLAKIILGIRNLRASGSVFDGIMVAKGKYGAYLNRTCKIWDSVGQHIIIEEAGGLYTDFFGKPLDYSNPLAKAEKNFTWCLGAPQIHKQLQVIIHG